MIYDCLIIGHNQMDFREYELSVRKMGEGNEAYRDLLFNFVRLNGIPCTFSDVFNEYVKDDNNRKLSFGETFSSTLSYLMSYGAKRGITFDYILDFQHEKQLLLDKLRNNQYRTIAITTTLYVSFWPIKEIINWIGAFKHKAKIIIGGPYIFNLCMLQDEATINYILGYIGADIYIESIQGERALVESIKAVQEGRPLWKVENIYYKLGGQFEKTTRSIENNQLCDNMVDWSLFQDCVGEYVSLRTCISCAFNCSFCAFPKHAGKYQSVGIDSIKYELDGLKKTGKVKSIHFVDDTFNVPQARFKDILRLMIDNQYHFKWHSYLRCQYLDEETVELMKKSGVEGVFLGIESGNQQILDSMNKRVKVEDLKRGIQLLKDYDITTFASFIVGFPGETDKTVQDTISFICEMHPDFYRAQLWYCDMLTDVYADKEKYQIQGSQFSWRHKTMTSQEAMNWIERMFYEIKESIWIPQYDFDFDSLFHLTHQGVSMENIKKLLTVFNCGVKMNMKQSTDSDQLIQEFKEIKKQIITGV